MNTPENFAVVAAKADIALLTATVLLRTARSEPLRMVVSAYARHWRATEVERGAPEQYLVAFDEVLGDLLRSAAEPD